MPRGVPATRSPRLDFLLGFLQSCAIRSIVLYLRKQKKETSQVALYFDFVICNRTDRTLMLELLPQCCINLPQVSEIQAATFKLLPEHCWVGVNRANMANMANCPFLENVPPQIGIICLAITQYEISKRKTYKVYGRIYCKEGSYLWRDGHYVLRT